MLAVYRVSGSLSNILCPRHKSFVAEISLVPEYRILLCGIHVNYQIYRLPVNDTGTCTSNDVCKERGRSAALTQNGWIKNEVLHERNL